MTKEQNEEQIEKVFQEIYDLQVLCDSKEEVLKLLVDTYFEGKVDLGIVPSLLAFMNLRGAVKLDELVMLSEHWKLKEDS